MKIISLMKNSGMGSIEQEAAGKYQPEIYWKRVIIILETKVI